MSKKFSRNLLAVAIAIGVQANAEEVSAQDDGLGFALEEIVVTAQKREQSLQEVPSTVNAVQGDALAEMKLFGFEDLEQVTPGLDMRSVSGRAGSIALRGVDYNPNTAAAAAVDVYWNDATLGSNASGGLFQQMFDLGRVEVLRGPQGTLQGRTSPGGAIAIHTAKPNLDEEEGYVRTTFTDNGGNNTQFAASLPIIPGELAIRVAGAYDVNDGNDAKNIITGDKSDNESRAGRISVTWEPTDTLSVDFSYQYMESNSELVRVLTGSPSAAVSGQNLPVLESRDGKGINVQPEQTDGLYKYTALNVEWEVADHTLTFVSGYSELASQRAFDATKGNGKLGFDPYSGPAVPGFGWLLNDPRTGDGVAKPGDPTKSVTSQINDPKIQTDRSYASSQEFRVASMDNDFWNYTVGLYYASESGTFNVQQAQAQGITLPGPTRLAAHWNVEARTPFDKQSYGVFAHNIFHFTDQLTGQLGIRWQRQEEHLESAVYALEDGYAVPGTAPAALQALGFSAGDELTRLLDEDLETSNVEKWTGSASLQYAFDEPDLVVYANAATSFRPGGVNITPKSLGEKASFNEEDSWSLEVGVKSTLWDDRLRLNASVFYQDYSDYIGRINTLNFIDTNGKVQQAPLTTNGDAVVQGVEVEFEAMLSENWLVAGGIGYTEAEYKDGVTQYCNEGTLPSTHAEFAATCDVSGLELGTQPRFSMSLSSDYTVPFDAFDGYVQGLYKFNGRRTDVDAPSGDLGGYGTLDLHLGLREAGGSWDVSLFVRNLFDKEAIDSMATAALTKGTKESVGYQQANTIPGRLIGLSAIYSF